jgi:hypothetical protein
VQSGINLSTMSIRDFNTLWVLVQADVNHNAIPPYTSCRPFSGDAEAEATSDFSDNPCSSISFCALLINMILIERDQNAPRTRRQGTLTELF